MEKFLFAPTAVAAAVDWTETATVVIAGICIVLLILIVLIFVFYIFGALVSSRVNKNSKNSKKEKAKKKKEEHKEDIPAAVVEKTKPVKIENTQTAEETKPDDLIAVISAAVAASEGENNFTIKSIKKKNTTQRNAWAFAAVSHNTKPF